MCSVFQLDNALLCTSKSILISPFFPPCISDSANISNHKEREGSERGREGVESNEQSVCTPVSTSFIDLGDSKAEDRGGDFFSFLLRYGRNVCVAEFALEDFAHEAIGLWYTHCDVVKNIDCPVFSSSSATRRSVYSTIGKNPSKKIKEGKEKINLEFFFWKKKDIQPLLCSSPFMISCPLLLDAISFFDKNHNFFATYWRPW